MATDWYLPAIKLIGPANKTNPGSRQPEYTGIVAHSAEGAGSVLLGILADPNSEVSWHFSNLKDGTLYQHYPTSAQCWHAGPKGNPFYIGIEHEGKAGEALTDKQIANLVNLIRWLASSEPWARIERRSTLWEHRELMQTACPSGRIPWDTILTQLAPTSSPAPTDLILALVSAAEFTRREWNYGDLLPADKEAIKWLSAQL